MGLPRRVFSLLAMTRYFALSHFSSLHTHPSMNRGIQTGWKKYCEIIANSEVNILL
ncbi:MAG: hypothetical protein ABIJ23_02650 [Candidatus Magasanikbacteria bacterium]